MRMLFSGEKPNRLPLPGTILGTPAGLDPWAETLARWQNEGLPAGVVPNVALKLMSEDGIGLPLNLNMVPTFPIYILEEDQDYVTLVDEYSVTKKMLRSDYDRSGGYMKSAGATSAMSYWIDFPVKDIQSWKEIYEERFLPNLEGRLPDNWEEIKADFLGKSESRWVSYSCFPFFGLFGPLRELMGLERLLFTMVDDPKLIHTIIDDFVNFWLATFAQVLSDVRLDHVTLFEDMCATKASMIGPGMFREFLSPGYHKVITGLKEMGVQQFWIDTDGNAWDIIPEMLICGITGISPCEVQASMYVEVLRNTFPTLFLCGGVDKRALRRDFAAIELELKRCYKVAWEKGRYIPALDHAAPPDIPWANAQHFAKRSLELVSAPPS